MKLIIRCLHLFLLVLLLGPSHAAERKIVRTHIDEGAPWSSGPMEIKLPQHEHPYLFINTDKINQLREQAKSDDWASSHINKIVKAADAALTQPLTIPDKPAQWSMHYVCKDCGISLQHQGNENICPRCGRKYTGWPYDEVVAGRTHIKNIINAQQLGLAYQFTGNQAYAKRVRETLLGYAARYSKWPIHDYKGGTADSGGHLFAQTLDASVRMIPFVWAYDLVYNAPSMTAADRAIIENKLFRPAAKTIRRNDMGISNWQTWHNAAMTAIGITLDDPAMVDYSVNGPHGLKFQLRESVLADGFWYEGTASYHFYALNAIQKQLLALQGIGIDLYKDPVAKSLYDAPLDYLFPDGRFPAVNDSSALPIDGQKEFYEVAYSWYKEPRYAAVADGPRSSQDAFLFGVKSLPKVKLPPLRSQNFRGLGAVMLRQTETTNPLVVHLDYGPHGGYHGHNDKLNIILFANGADVMPDPSRLAYAAPLHKAWYKRSIAHNTIIMDGRDQAKTGAHLVSQNFDGEVKFATAVCDTAYRDVTITRSLALAPEYLLDATMADAPTTHTFDLAYHVRGKEDAKHPGLQFKPSKLKQKSNGYQILKNVRMATAADGRAKLTFRQSGKKRDRKVTLQQTSTNPAKIILADGLTDSNVTTCPVMINRQKSPHPVWITLSVPTQGGDATPFELESHKDESGEWTLTVSNDKKRAVYRLSADGELRNIK